MSSATFSYQHIYSLISRIPPGCVATYGQIAQLAGIPGHARAVGYALSALDSRTPIPWHRVVNAAGEISKRAHSVTMENLQRIRLENEGIRFDAKGRVRLSEARWQPGSSDPLP